MNTPNPLIPQGSLDNKKSKSNFRIVVIGILAFHAVLIVGLLMQGCKPDEKEKNDTKQGTTQTRPSLPVLPPIEPTNPPTAIVPKDPVVPTSPPPLVTETPTAPAAAKEYTIVKGDFFEKIAKANGVTLAAIEKANPGVDPKKLKVGQKIQIPAATPKASAKAAVLEAAPTEGSSVYEVKSGDTLTKIAAANGTTVKALRSANDLKTDKLKVSQKLKLPAKSAAATTPTTTDAAPPVAPVK